MATTVLYLIIDIHLLQIIVQVRRIIHHLRSANRVEIKDLMRELEIEADILKYAVSELEKNQYLRWTTKRKRLVH